MIHDNTFTEADFQGAKGIVFLGDMMLVYRRDTKTNKFPLHIDLPGGARDENETPFKTFQREVKEEFGVEIEKDEVVFSCRFSSTIEPNEKTFFIVVKTVRFKPDDVVFGDEGTEWMLMTPNEFISHPDGIEKQQKLVADYLKGNIEIK